jgi:hypothetical protein
MFKKSKIALVAAAALVVGAIIKTNAATVDVNLAVLG